MLLQRDAGARALIGLSVLPHTEPAMPKELIASLVSGWFSSRRSTEPMKRGTENEDAVLSALQKRRFIKGVFEVGMLASNLCNWVACSPDGIAVLDLQHTPFHVNEGVSDSTTLASIEIKTSVADSSLQNNLLRSTTDVIYCSVGDATCRLSIPEEHIFQVLLQLCIIKTQYGIYLAASETGLMRAVVIKCGQSTLDSLLSLLTQKSEHLVSWAHCHLGEVPYFADGSTRRKIKAHLPFWKIINSFVITKHFFHL